MESIVIIVIDCADDRCAAAHNLERLRHDVAGRAPIVTVRRTGLSSLAVERKTDEGATRGACLGRALLTSTTRTAHAVVVTDTDTEIAPGWYDAAAHAFAEGADLIAGPVRPRNAEEFGRTSTTAGFALDYLCHADPPFLNAAGHPSANNFGARRSLFDDMVANHPRTDVWKTEFCDWAHGHGIVTQSVAAMAVVSTKRDRPRKVLVDQFKRGCLHASIRSRTTSTIERIGRILGFAIVPFIGTARIATRSRWQPTPASWPLVFAGLCAWACGEAIGYCAPRLHLGSETFG